MFTPQQLEQITFHTSVFGGYDMDSVDEFLVALIEDYNTLYKDNATLKSKMRVLVEKLEEYRAEEGGAKENLRAAQQTCDAMIRGRGEVPEDAPPGGGSGPEYQPG